MATAATTTILAQPDTPPLIDRAAATKRSKFLGKNLWALGDQVLISGANFVTMVLPKWSMSPSEFGDFSLVYSVLLLANIIQSTLVTQAHNVLGVTRSGLAYRRYTTSAAAAQGVLAAGEAVLALAFALSYGLIHSTLMRVHPAAAHWQWPPAAMFLALVPSIFAWQLQEFVRRVMYTEGRFCAAYWNDVLSYGGQMAVVIVLWRTDTLHGASALYALATTSAAAAALGFWQIRTSLGGGVDWSVIRENWRFGRWLTGGELLQWCSSLQMYMYLVAMLLGTAASGDLRAVQTLFGPMRVFTFYLGSVLPIRFARELVDTGHAGVHVLFRATCARVLPLLGVYCLAVAIVPRFILHLVYGDKFVSTPLLLSLYAGYTFVSYVPVLLASVLTAKQLNRPVFLGSVYGAIVALPVGWLTIGVLGVAGAPVAMAISSIIIAGFLWRSYTRGMDEPTMEGAMRTPPTPEIS